MAEIGDLWLDSYATGRYIASLCFDMGRVF